MKKKQRIFKTIGVPVLGLLGPDMVAICQTGNGCSFPFDQMAAAHKQIEYGRTVGKAVIVP